MLEFLLLSLVTILLERKLCFVGTVKIMTMLIVCSSTLINDFTGLHEHNVYDICFIGLMDDSL